MPLSSTFAGVFSKNLEELCGKRCRKTWWRWSTKSLRRFAWIIGDSKTPIRFPWSTDSKHLSVRNSCKFMILFEAILNLKFWMTKMKICNRYYEMKADAFGKAYESSVILEGFFLYKVWNLLTLILKPRTCHDQWSYFRRTVCRIAIGTKIWVVHKPKRPGPSL